MKRRRIFCLPAPAILLSAIIVLLAADPLPAAAEAAVLPPPEVDVAVSGFQQGGTRRNGILLSDQLKYRLTVSNVGDTALSAGAVSLTVTEGPLGPGERGGFVATTLNSGDFDTSSGSCQVGAADTVRCITTREIPPGGQARLTISYRHNQAVSGELALFANVAPNRSAFIDPAPSNNSFVGPGYFFDPSLVTPEETVPDTTSPDTTVPDTTSPDTGVPEPDTTSTTEVPGTETTVDPDGTETTVDPDGTETTVDPDGTETTVDPDGTETTVDPDGTETTVDPDGTETTVDPDGTETTVDQDDTATTAVEQTTVTTVSTTLATPVAPAAPTATVSPNEQAPVVPVGGAGEGDGTLESGDESAAPPVEGSDGGPVLWLLALGLLALSAALGGALFVYQRYYKDDAPLVDIRHYR